MDHMLEVGCNVWFRRRTLPHTLLLPIAEFQLLSFLELGELGYIFVSIFMSSYDFREDKTYMESEISSDAQ